MATIQQYRPDLLQGRESGDVAIPEEIPSELLAKQTPHVPDIGQPMTACFITQTNTNPIGWYLLSHISLKQSFCCRLSYWFLVLIIRWLFEKYDGMRGFWNHTKRMFFSRNGNKINAPQFLIDLMPTDIFLDGEFWYIMNSFVCFCQYANLVIFKYP